MNREQKKQMKARLHKWLDAQAYIDREELSVGYLSVEEMKKYLHLEAFKIIEDLYERP